MTQSFPSRFAVARSRVASLPTAGSVRPKQPMTSPLQRCGSQVRFCSSVPNFRIVISTSEIWTDRVVRTGDDRVRDEIDAHPAVLLWDRAAEEADGRHLLEHVVGKALGAIALARTGRDLTVGELVRELVDLLLLWREVEVH